MGKPAKPIPTTAKQAVELYSYPVAARFRLASNLPDNFVCCNNDDVVLRNKILEDNRYCLSTVSRWPQSKTPSKFPRTYFPVMTEDASGVICCFLLAAYVELPPNLVPPDQSQDVQEMYSLLVRIFVAYQLQLGAVVGKAEQIASRSGRHWAAHVRVIIKRLKSYAIDPTSPLWNSALAVAGALAKVVKQPRLMPSDLGISYNDAYLSLDFYNKFGYSQSLPAFFACSSCLHDPEKQDKRHKGRACLIFADHTCCLGCFYLHRSDRRCFVHGDQDNLIANQGEFDDSREDAYHNRNDPAGAAGDEEALDEVDSMAPPRAKRRKVTASPSSTKRPSRITRAARVPNPSRKKIAAPGSDKVSEPVGNDGLVKEIHAMGLKLDKLSKQQQQTASSMRDVRSQLSKLTKSLSARPKSRELGAASNGTGESNQLEPGDDGSETSSDETPWVDSDKD